MAKAGKNDLKERFIELRAAGLSYADIAREMSVSKPTLLAWGKELTLQVQNARTMRLDELFERYAVAKEKRVEAFGRRLESILAELDKRDLTDVSTAQLFTLALKYGEYLRAEHEPLEVREEGEGSLLDFDDITNQKPIRSWSV